MRPVTGIASRHTTKSLFGVSARNGAHICPSCTTRQIGQTAAKTAARKFCTSNQHQSESVQPETYYDFFRTTLPKGPPPEGPFMIDTAQLRREFLQMQAKAHPDLHPQEMKSRAEALSARINEAYKTLQDPLQRTQYLLALKGVDVAQDETAKVDDQALLMDVLEAQEEIEGATDAKELEDLMQTNDQRLQKSVVVLEEAFARDDIATAKVEAVRFKYWTNVRDSIRNWEPGKPISLVH